MNVFFTRYLSLILITTLLASCDFWNTKVPSTKVKKPTKTKLQLLRESFAKDELGLMQYQISESVKTYNEFQKVVNELKTKSGAAAEEINQLDNEFHKAWGELGKVIQSKLESLEKRFQVNKKEFVHTKVELKNNKSQLDKLAASFKSCEKDLNTQKRHIENKISHATRVLQGHKNKIESHKKAIARNKKRANRSNWPSDKKKYRNKAKKHAKKANEIAKKATSDKKKFENEINALAKKAQAKADSCSHIGENAHKLKEVVLEQNEIMLHLKDVLEQTKAEIETIQYENDDFFTAYETYQTERDLLTEGAQKRIDELAKKYKEQQETLILAYGEDYPYTFQKLKAWHESTTIDGDESLALINELKAFASKTLRIEEILEKMVAILQEASQKQKVSMQSRSTNYRKVASFLSDLLGIDIDLSKITIIKITMPDLNINLPELKLPELNLAKIQIKMPRIQLGSLALDHIKLHNVHIQIPEIKLMNTDINIHKELDGIFKSLDVEIRTPKIEIIHIEVDLHGDLKSPGKILKNTEREVLQTITSTEQKIAKTLSDLKRETDSTIGNIQREGGKGLNKVGAVLEAAGQPENLARIAIVYAATISAGPAGAALANALIDKMQNPEMSDRELFNSFVIGAAAGYAAQGVTKVPIKSIQSMPNAASAITRNLTADAGNILLNGQSYSAKDLLTSIVRGAANVNTGESYANEILDSALNSGIDYTIRTVADGKQFDAEAFEIELYRGMAEGFTRESIHALMDKYVAHHLPKDLEKKAIEHISDLIFEKEKLLLQIQIEKFESLSYSEKVAIIDELNEINDSFTDYLIENFNENELKHLDLSSAEFQSLREEYITQKIIESEGALTAMELSRVDMAILNRTPNSGAIKGTLMAAFILYNAYNIYNDSGKLKEKFQKYNKETGKSYIEFLKDHPYDVVRLTVDSTIAMLPAVKHIGKAFKLTTKEAVKLVAAAKKLGLKSQDKITEFAKFSATMLGASSATRRDNEAKAWSGANKFNGLENAFKQWEMHSKSFPELKSAKDYVNLASHFVTYPPAGTISKTRANGDKLFYYPRTNIFAVKTKKGVPKTIFKPKAGKKYWDNLIKKERL